MIIKYYHKGWNMIDNVENVNVDFERTDKLSEKLFTDETCSLLLQDFQRTLSSKKYVFEAMCFVNANERLEVGDFHAIPALEDRFAEEFFNREDGEFSFIHVLTLTKPDFETKAILVTDGDIYIMNDEGKTIDKYSSRQ